MVKKTAKLAGMRPILAILLVLGLARAEELPADVAARHPEGKWTIRKADFYRYLVAYSGSHPSARAVLPDYMKQRLVQQEAHRRKVTVTDEDLDRWIAALDAEIREKTGGTHTLEKEYTRHGMSEEEFRRRSRTAMLRERVARDVMNGRDPTRRRDKELDESTVTLVIDELFQSAPKAIGGKDLPDGVIARIRDVDITDYEYGRELSFALPATDVLRSLRELILVHETHLLLGSDAAPTPEELAVQKRWFMDMERTRLERMAGGQTVTDEIIADVVAKRGLSLEEVFANPAFLAQARARGHFLRTLTDEDLRGYYEANASRYSDQLKVARILVIARAQPVTIAGRKVRTLQEGKALADALWLRATQGMDFGALARENSEDPDVVRDAGGILPLWLTAQTPGYEDTWAQANALREGEVSRPFFSQGRGYVLVKLIERREAAGFEALRESIREDAAEQAYGVWRYKAVRAAIKSEGLLDEE